MKTIKLLLAEDHSIVRQGLSDILEKHEDICIVAEAEDGASMVKKYFEFKPTVVLSDIEMTGMDGITAAIEILEKDSDARIMFLTMYNTDDYMVRAFKIGASGLLSKSIHKGELVNAIRSVAAGNKYFMNRTMKELRELASKYENAQAKAAAGGKEELTPRQIAILEFIAEGLKSEDIADRLNVSKRTVDADRSKIMALLDLKTPNHLVLFAVQNYLRK